MKYTKLDESLRIQQSIKTDIASRIQRDSDRIRKACTTYLGTVIPWEPELSFGKKDKWNYHFDKSRNIGWCFNAKVSM